MKREEKFVLSHRPYAVDLGSLTRDKTYHRVVAAWFRRRKGVTAACLGYLGSFQSPIADGASQFLEHYDDGRYGGECEARWDGTGYWGYEQPEIVADNLAFLRPMLANYPAVPDGFDGWWRF